MALIKCKECGHKISKKASACPECGFDFKKEREERDQLMGFGLLIILVVGGWFWFTSGESSTTSSTQQTQTHWTQETNWAGAYVMTEEWVKQRLSSPGSAEFPSSYHKRQHVERVSGQRYRIESYVDSQNQFGALVRTQFVAELEQPEEDKWRLLSLELSD